MTNNIQPIDDFDTDFWPEVSYDNSFFKFMAPPSPGKSMSILDMMSIAKTKYYDFESSCSRKMIEESLGLDVKREYAMLEQESLPLVEMEKKWAEEIFSEPMANQWIKPMVFENPYLRNTTLDDLVITIPLELKSSMKGTTLSNGENMWNFFARVMDCDAPVEVVDDILDVKPPKKTMLTSRPDEKLVQVDRKPSQGRKVLSSR